VNGYPGRGAAALPAGEQVLAAWLSGRAESTVAAYLADLRHFSAFTGTPGPGAAAGLLLARGHGGANALALAWRGDMLQRGLSPATVNRRRGGDRLRLSRALGHQLGENRPGAVSLTAGWASRRRHRAERPQPTCTFPPPRGTLAGDPLAAAAPVVRSGGGPAFSPKGHVMGMDVVGRNPSSPAGEYFRASIWTWPPIHSRIAQLCPDLFDEETLRAMAFNDGAGAEDQRTCTEMANRFRRWLEDHTAGVGVRLDPDSPAGGLLKARGAAMVNQPTYYADDEDLKRWVEFLDHCGGFEVW
jgi:hypothetical protein